VDQSERSGVLVLRVWTESREDVPLWATITAERDLDAAARTEIAAAGLPEIVDVVRAWLEEFVEPVGR
jgi:hypothetical protein